MVFADKANLLLGAWQCASTLLPILMKLFRFSPYMSGHWVISIEIRSICIRSAFGVAKNCKCYESWYSCLGLQRRVMWNIKRDNPAAIQFCWSGSDKQYWVKRRKQYSPSTQVCNNILQVPKFATIFPKYQSLQQYSLKQKLGQLERNPSETLLMFTDSMFSHRIPLNNRVNQRWSYGQIEWSHLWQGPLGSGFAWGEEDSLGEARTASHKQFISSYCDYHKGYQGLFCLR